MVTSASAWMSSCERVGEQCATAIGIGRFGMAGLIHFACVVADLATERAPRVLPATVWQPKHVATDDR